VDVKEIDGRVWTGINYLKIGAVAGCSERGSELSGSITGGKVFLSN
jgi:hypothetical protein